MVTLIAYFVALALKEKQGIFEIAIRYAFSGFAAMSPVMVAALFWKRSTKWGALAATPLCGRISSPLDRALTAAPGTNRAIFSGNAGDIKVFFINPRGDVSFWNGFMTVLPDGPRLRRSASFLFSLFSPPPSDATIAKYFTTTSPHASS